jgi:site-specific recombinase XerD
VATFTSWQKILGHSNIKMTERYAKLAKHHIARTSNTAREMWKLLEPVGEKEAVGKPMYAYCTRADL